MGTTAPVTAVESPPAADRVVAIVLLIALGLVTPIVSFLGLMFSMVSDGCGGEAACSADQLELGIAVAVFAPWVALVGAVVMVVKGVRRRRQVWWVPLVAALIGAGLFALGAILAATAAG